MSGDYFIKMFLDMVYENKQKEEPQPTAKSIEEGWNRLVEHMRLLEERENDRS